MLHRGGQQRPRSDHPVHFQVAGELLIIGARLPSKMVETRIEIPDIAEAAAAEEPRVSDSAFHVQSAVRRRIRGVVELRE